jgi:glucokinase
VSREPAIALVADVGGTTSRIAIVARQRRGRAARLGSILKLANDEHASLDALLAKAVAALDAAKVRTAVLAVAGPVASDEVMLTNRPWTLRRQALSERFGWRHIEVINDFAAIAWSLPRLSGRDLAIVAPGKRDATAPMLALGPGTGLGVGAFWPDASDGGRVLASEAGHMSLGASCLAESRIFAALQAGGELVKAETIISGPGLSRLYGVMVPEAGPLPAATIARRLADGEADARPVIDMFATLLGRFAGDLALAFGASGGVYLAGGVLQRLYPFIDTGLVMGAFTNHPGHEAWLRRVPVRVITAEEPGLIGCAAVADMAFR